MTRIYISVVMEKVDAAHKLRVRNELLRYLFEIFYCRLSMTNNLRI